MFIDSERRGEPLIRDSLPPTIMGFKNSSFSPFSYLSLMVLTGSVLASPSPIHRAFKPTSTRSHRLSRSIA